MRHSVLAPAVLVSIDLEPKPVVGITPDVAGDRAFVLLDVAPDNSHVPPLDRMLEELAGQVKLCLIVFRHDKKAGSVLVYSVHQNPHPLIGRFRPLGYAQMKGKSIDESSLEVAVPRMNNHSGRFVDNKKVVVLIDYVQRDVLRQDLEAAAAVRHHEADHIAGTYNEVRFRNLVIHTYIAFLDGTLDPVP